MPDSILIADGDKSARLTLVDFFKSRGFKVLSAETGRGVVEQIESNQIDIVLLDIRFTDISSLEILEKIKSKSPKTAVIMLAADSDIETAVFSMKLRADNFLLKPVDLPQLEFMVEKCLLSYKAEDELQSLKKKASMRKNAVELREIKQPPEVYHAVKLLSANSSTNVLILGETGTGKGMIARLIHDSGPRASMPFMDINCAGLNSQLLESELFGHEQGAFTDAKKTKRGLLEVADNGTIFLDEVAELSPSVQAKLLKVIEQRSFRRLGGTSNINVDVRIIAATNSDLEKAVENGSFRKDLFFRINIIPIKLPPLRERKEDILPLAYTFLEEFKRIFAKKIVEFAAEVENALLAYSWPGNIRELRNVVERATLLCAGGKIDNIYLPQTKQLNRNSHKNSDNHFLPLEEMEKKHIREVLESCDNNRSKASEILGIHRTTLIKKIRKYDIK